MNETQVKRIWQIGNENVYIIWMVQMVKQCCVVYILFAMNDKRTLVHSPMVIPHVLFRTLRTIAWIFMLDRQCENTLCVWANKYSTEMLIVEQYEIVYFYVNVLLDLEFMTRRCHYDFSHLYIVCALYAHL